jgi:3,4-dihydroxy-2-butanone 4-phosphate synthase
MCFIAWIKLANGVVRIRVMTAISDSQTLKIRELADNTPSNVITIFTVPMDHRATTCPGVKKRRGRAIIAAKMIIKNKVRTK